MVNRTQPKVNDDNDQDVEYHPLKQPTENDPSKTQINEAIQINFDTIANPNAESCKQLKAIDDLLNYSSKLTKEEQKEKVYGKLSLLLILTLLIQSVSKKSFT